MSEIIINIAESYTKTPGGRYICEGAFSGEDFRESQLLPKVEFAIKNNCKITVVLDGGFGYAPSFLEEAFGGLMRKLKDQRVLELITIISEEEPMLVEKVNKYMRDAVGVN